MSEIHDSTRRVHMSRPSNEVHEQDVFVRRSVLQCVAVCCSVLQCVAVCCSVLQCVAVSRSVLQYVTACFSVLQYVVVCCSVLQSVAVRCNTRGVSNTFGERGVGTIQPDPGRATKTVLVCVVTITRPDFLCPGVSTKPKLDGIDFDSCCVEMQINMTHTHTHTHTHTRTHTRINMTRTCDSRE